MGRKTILIGGFKIWNRKDKLQIHVGGINSPHNQVVKNNEDLMKQKQQIESVFVKQSN